MWDVLGATAVLATFASILLAVMFLLSGLRFDGLAVALLTMMMLAPALMLGRTAGEYVADTPVRTERDRLAYLIEQTTPEWNAAALKRINEQREWVVFTAKAAKARWACDNRPLDQFTAPEYAHHRGAVMIHNRLVAEYQAAQVRYLHGAQYAGLGVLESLPQPLRTCRGEALRL